MRAELYGTTAVAVINATQLNAIELNFDQIKVYRGRKYAIHFSLGYTKYTENLFIITKMDI